MVKSPFVHDFMTSFSLSKFSDSKSNSTLLKIGTIR